MMKQDRKHIAALLGAGIVGTLSATQSSAQENPFALAELGAAARVAEATSTDVKAKAGEAADKIKGAGEMKCGAQMMKKDIKAPEVPDPKAAAGAAGAKMQEAMPAEPASPPSAGQ